MLGEFWPVIPLIGTVTLLIRAELGGKMRQAGVFKVISSALMWLVALLAIPNPTVNRTYLFGITIGLTFSFVGDVLLIASSNRAFLAGLVSFLLAHVAYLITLTLHGGWGWADLILLALLTVPAVKMYCTFQPGLGAMRGPVLVYIAVISLMVQRALSTLFVPRFDHAAAWLVGIGAVLFYVSDAILAYSRFVKRLPYHSFSLAFYYAGQTLIGASTHLMH